MNGCTSNLCELNGCMFPQACPISTAPEPRPDCKCGHPASYHINFAHEGEPIPPGPPNYPRKQNFCRHPTELTPSGFCACRNYSAPSNPEEPRDCRAYSSDNIGYYCSLPVGHEGDHRAMAGMNTILCAQWAASPLPEEPPRLLTLKESNDPANDNRFSEPCLGCGWTKWAWRNLDAKNCSWCAAEEPPELKTLIEILIATITAPYVEHRQECHDRAHAAVVALFGRQREESGAFQDDVRDLLLALGLGDHARPISPHRVVQDEILPAVASLQSQLERQREEIEINATARLGGDALISRIAELESQLERLKAEQMEVIGKVIEQFRPEHPKRCTCGECQWWIVRASNTRKAALRRLSQSEP